MFVKGDKLTAIKRFNQAWLLDQNCYLAFEGFAVISKDRGNLVDAIKYYQTAIGLNTDEPRLADSCALILLQKADLNKNKKKQADEYQRALQLFKSAARKGDAKAQNNLGYIYVD